MDSMQQHIIEEYRQADFKRQMHLFLEYPALRTEFSEIDHREEPIMYPSFLISQQKVFNVSVTFGSVLQWVGGLLRRRCCLVSEK